MARDLNEGTIFFSVVALLALFIALRIFLPDGIRVPGQPLPQVNRAAVPATTVDPSSSPATTQTAPRATVP